MTMNTFSRMITDSLRTTIAHWFTYQTAVYFCLSLLHWDLFPTSSRN